MKVTLGVLYTPFIPGGAELEHGVEEARQALASCDVRVIDAASDALTLLDMLGDSEIFVLVAPGGERIERQAYELPLRSYDTSEVPDEIRASLEGSLDANDTIRALSALLAFQGRRLYLVLYKCGRGYCSRALREAIAEVMRLAKCPSANPDAQQIKHDEEYEEEHS